MKTLFIYGAPATGKLTISREIARLTRFKVFHNHLSIDCVKPVFEFGSAAFWRINAMIREQTIAEATREGINLIHTFCYAKGPDDEGFGRLIAAVEDNGGETHLVLLLCGDDERRARIANESRVKIGKLTDPDSVTRSRTIHDLESPYPGRETLSIDTTSVSPEAVAEHIIEHFGLEKLTAGLADAPRLD